MKLWKAQRLFSYLWTMKIKKKNKRSKSKLGMQSVIHGIDNNPAVTAADPKAKFIKKNGKAS